MEGLDSCVVLDILFDHSIFFDILLEGLDILFDHSIFFPYCSINHLSYFGDEPLNKMRKSLYIPLHLIMLLWSSWISSGVMDARDILI